LRWATTHTVLWPLPQPKLAAPPTEVEGTLQERLALYQLATESARQAGDSAKMRRYDRGLKVRGRG
jgi:coiled-coil and C2 domain-containing protein 1